MAISKQVFIGRNNFKEPVEICELENGSFVYRVYTFSGRGWKFGKWKEVNSQDLDFRPNCVIVGSGNPSITGIFQLAHGEVRKRVPMANV